MMAIHWRRIPTETSDIRCTLNDLGAQHCDGDSLAKNSNRNIRVLCQRKLSDVASAAAAVSWASLGRKVAWIPPRRKGSQKCWRTIPTDTSERSVRESNQILLVSAHADLKH